MAGGWSKSVEFEACLAHTLRLNMVTGAKAGRELDLILYQHGFSIPGERSMWALPRLAKQAVICLSIVFVHSGDLRANYIPGLQLLVALDGRVHLDRFVLGGESNEQRPGLVIEVMRAASNR